MDACACYRSPRYSPAELLPPSLECSTHLLPEIAAFLTNASSQKWKAQAQFFSGKFQSHENIE
jgi:hypothetical protein